MLIQLKTTDNWCYFSADDTHISITQVMYHDRILGVEVVTRKVKLVSYLSAVDCAPKILDHHLIICSRPHVIACL